MTDLCAQLRLTVATERVDDARSVATGAWVVVWVDTSVAVGPVTVTELT
jgi:hypothetical protein